MKRDGCHGKTAGKINKILYFPEAKKKERAEDGFLYDYEKLLRTPVPFSADEAVEVCECDE